jgi:hypothetical protein
MVLNVALTHKGHFAFMIHEFLIHYFLVVSDTKPSGKRILRLATADKIGPTLG